MGRTLRKTLLYVLLLTAGVTLGLQMSEPASPDQETAANQTAETENVYTFITPDGRTGYFVVPQQTDSVQGETVAQLPLTAEELAGVLRTPADLLLPDPEAPVVDRFADKTASLLQQLSRRSIHWVSSWFEPEE